MFHLGNKEHFLVTRITDLFLAEPSYTAGTHLARDHGAATLDLERARDSAGWAAFLVQVADLLAGVARRRPETVDGIGPGQCWPASAGARRAGPATA